MKITVDIPALHEDADAEFGINLVTKKITVVYGRLREKFFTHNMTESEFNVLKPILRAIALEIPGVSNCEDPSF